MLPSLAFHMHTCHTRVGGSKMASVNGTKSHGFADVEIVDDIRLYVDDRAAPPQAASTATR